MTRRSASSETVTTVDLRVHHAGYTLAGTLHLPASTQPVPTVVMLQGCGAADRNSGDFFPPIRDAFLSRGLAVYSFDKPGVAESTGNWRHVALFDQAVQAEAVIRALQAHPPLTRPASVSGDTVKAPG
jgi:fermentation-respiration switch protein FrsA (DUF1100 family)